MSSPTIDESVLRLRANRSDEDAWKVLFNRFWPFAFATCFRLLAAQKERAEDAAQEAFARIVRYTTFEEMSGADDFMKYLRVVCRSVCMKEIARFASESNVELENEWGDAFSIEPGLRTFAMEEELIANETYGQIIKTLSAREQQVLNLILAGFSSKEIAKRLNIQYSTVGVYTLHIRNKVRFYLNSASH